MDKYTFNVQDRALEIAKTWWNNYRDGFTRGGTVPPEWIKLSAEERVKKGKRCKVVAEEGLAFTAGKIREFMTPHVPAGLVETVLIGHGLVPESASNESTAQWIPVTERWPDPLQRVNFVVDSPGLYEHGKVYGGAYVGDSGHESPYRRNGFSTPGCVYRASHWMPSPEPPKTAHDDEEVSK